MKRLLLGKKVKIVHISDLHLPDSELDLQATFPIKNSVWASLWQRDAEHESPWEDANICILTGDLAKESPSRNVYKALRKELDARFPAKEQRFWVAIPGNHDRKRFGVFGRPNNVYFEQEFGDQWNLARWYKYLPLIFLPLDSNPSKKNKNTISWANDLARGCAGEEVSRMREALHTVKAQIEEEVRSDLSELTDAELISYGRRFVGALDPLLIAAVQSARLKDSDRGNLVQELGKALGAIFFARAVRCVLLHHHPIGIPGTDRSKSVTSQDIYLAMTDAGTFLEEARKNGVSLICHGHKHMSHRIAVTLPGDSEAMSIVGCGSTTASGDGEPSANVIEISQDGAVAVNTYIRSAGAWKTLGNELVVRTWPQVKRHISTAAVRIANYSVENVRFEAEILEHGDVVTTIEYDGIEHRSEESYPGVCQLPLSARTSAYPHPPSLAAKEGISEESFTATATPPGEWHGFLTFKSDFVNARVTIQHIGHCAFATNEWQFWGLYGRKSERSKTKIERIGWTSSTPIRKRLDLAISLSTQSRLYFGEVNPFCSLANENLDDVAERNDGRWYVSSSAKGCGGQFDFPRWGNTYGLGWKWAQTNGSRVNRGPTVSHSGESIRGRLERATEDAQQNPSADRKPSVCRSIGSLLRSELGDWPDLEATVYVLCRGDSTKRATLRQLVWNDATAHAQLQTFELPFGVGVAGRSMWMLRSVPWVQNDEDDDKEREFADYYYRGSLERTPHAAVVAFPLSVETNTYPIAVLSLASIKRDGFHELVRLLADQKSLAARNEGRAKVAPFYALRDKIQALIKEQ